MRGAHPMVVMYVGGGRRMLQTKPKSRHKLTADDIVSIRIAVKIGIPVRHIARMTCKPAMTISAIASGAIHAYVWSERLSQFEDC